MADHHLAVLLELLANVGRVHDGLTQRKRNATIAGAAHAGNGHAIHLCNLALGCNAAQLH